MTAQAQGPLSVLVVDDNPDIPALFARVFGARGHRVRGVAGTDAALRAIAAGGVDLVFTELAAPGLDGRAVLAAALDCADAPLVVMVTGFAGLERALEAVRDGAHDYLAKPFTQRQLEVIADNVAAFLRLRRENQVLTAELADAYRLIGEFSRDKSAEPDVAPERPSGAGEETSGGAAVPVVPSGEAVATYRAVAWNPDRAADRIAAMFAAGNLTREEYERLSRLIPRDLPTV